MPSQAPKAALRRMIVDLAALHEGDIAEILGHLGSTERQTVENLLQEYREAFDIAVPAPTPVPSGCDMARFSAWLAQRIDASPGDAGFEMTALARETLRNCATKLYPALPGNARLERRAPVDLRRQGAHWVGS